ncbi:hypothetical protein [Frankia sp. Cppng1_Ct_nod]|uniref:hypothetical protein n=1 Tax=Frankia sp. Cppng1_Ct_nod TaxID=2897162 RepID=UPI00104112DA|nr:hypothetical protein [Frankia sp. Cppng1_Ct_nod]
MTAVDTLICVHCTRGIDGPVEDLGVGPLHGECADRWRDARACFDTIAAQTASAIPTDAEVFRAHCAHTGRFGYVPQPGDNELIARVTEYFTRLAEQMSDAAGEDCDEPDEFDEFEQVVTIERCADCGAPIGDCDCDDPVIHPLYGYGPEHPGCHQDAPDAHPDELAGAKR